MKKSLNLLLFIGILFSPSLAQSAEFVVRTDCLHPSRDVESCEVTFSGDNEEVMEISWSGDNVTTKFRLTDDGEEFWDGQENKWNPISTVGICFNSKCFNSSVEAFGRLEQDYSSTMTGECWHPTRGRGNCTVEGVTETGGMRVHWPDGSTDHVILPTYNDEPTLVWSHADNGWVETFSGGICSDNVCVLDLF